MAEFIVGILLFIVLSLYGWCSYVLNQEKNRRENMKKQKKHFKLTDETITLEDGTILHRIECISPIEGNNIKVGDKGGFVEHEDNLDGNAWVYDDAMVYGNAWVFGEAKIYNNAQVYGEARVCGNAQIYGNAKVYDNATVGGEAEVYDTAQIFGEAHVFDYAKVYEDAYVFHDAKVFDNAEVYGEVELYGETMVYGDAKVTGNSWYCGKIEISKNALIEQPKDICVLSFLSCNQTITAFRCDDGKVYVNCNSCSCYFDKFEEFIKEFEDDKDGYLYKEWKATIDLIKVKFNI